MDINDVTPTRPLSESEMDELRALMKAQLNIEGSDWTAQMVAEDDANDLLDYAFDMIGSKESVGRVIDELEFMGLPVCNSAVAEKLRYCLAKFLCELNEEFQPVEEDNGAVEINVNVTAPEEVSVDLSAKNFAKKEKEEMQAIFRCEKKRSILDIKAYNTDGTVQPESEGKLDLSAKNAVKKKEKEIQELFGSKQLHNIHSIKAGLYSKNEADVEPELDDEKVDLSSTNAVKKREKEIQALFGQEGGKAGGLKSRMGIYNEKGELIKREKEDTDTSHTVSQASSQGDERRKELMAIMSDRSLSKAERSQRIEEVKRKYSNTNGPQVASASNTRNKKEQDKNIGMYKSDVNCTKKVENKVREISDYVKVKSVDESLDKNENSTQMEEIRRKYDTKKNVASHVLSSTREVDLSTNATSSKFSREKEALFRQDRAKGGGTEVSYTHQKDSDKNASQTKSKSIDGQRREELQAIMRDKSLSRDERKHKIQEVKSRFALLEQKQSSSNTSSRREAKAKLLAALEADDEEHHIDLSAKSYVTKKTQVLDTIRNAQGGNSLQQKKAAYSKNETIKAGAKREFKGKCVSLFLSFLFDLRIILQDLSYPFLVPDDKCRR
jgi:hypothetical protein